MAYGRRPSWLVGWSAGTPSVPGIMQVNEGATMKIIKSGTFRIVMLLSALASSGLVLEAARRW